MSNKHKKGNEKCNNREQMNKNNDTTNESDKIKTDKQELIKELNILNISNESLYIILLAVILNIKYVQWNKVKVLDSLNETNYSETLEDLTYVPKFSNKIYMFTSIIFLFINYDAYVTAINANREDEYEEKISDAGSNLFAIILIFFGTLINYRTLNKSK